MEPVQLSPSPAQSEASQPDIAESVGKDYKPYLPLYDRFGIPGRDDERVNRNLEVIWKWASDHAETKDKDSVLWQITKLTNRIGDSAAGSAPYSKALAYIFEYNRMLDAEKRMREMEGSR